MLYELINLHEDLRPAHRPRPAGPLLRAGQDHRPARSQRRRQDHAPRDPRLSLPSPSGEVRFMGQRVDFRGNGLIQHRRRVVLVQQHSIMFSTTVGRNVEFPLKVRNAPKPEREKVVEELLHLVGMRDFKEAKGNTLSGGETQRVAIARALACSPEVILFDEPTASVEVENQIAIERIIGEITGRKGISVSPEGTWQVILPKPRVRTS